MISLLDIIEHWADDVGFSTSRNQAWNREYINIRIKFKNDDWVTVYEDGEFVTGPEVYQSWKLRPADPNFFSDLQLRVERALK